MEDFPFRKAGGGVGDLAAVLRKFAAPRGGATKRSSKTALLLHYFMLEYLQDYFTPSSKRRARDGPLSVLA
jgi:hypothetical protein